MIQAGYDSARSDGVWGVERHFAPNGVHGGDSYLDPGIYEIVWGLNEAGIPTGWSCQGGGEPHASLARMVGFGINDEEAGPRALAVALKLGMPVQYLSRVLTVPDGTFWWELLFDRFTEWRRAGRC